MPATSTSRDSKAASAADDGRAVIARAALLLRTLEQHPDGLTIAQLTRASALPRTTVQRLVHALQAEQLLAVHDGKVGLGSALARLAVAAHRDVRERLRPHLESLAHETGETVDLWVLRDAAVVLVDQIVTRHEVRAVIPVGSTLPLLNTAPGKAFLAAWPDAAILALAARERATSSSAAPPTPEQRLADITEVRRTGIAWDLEEHAEDVCALACTVDLDSPERHAIAIPAPARRFQRHRMELEAALRRCMAAITGQPTPDA